MVKGGYVLNEGVGLLGFDLGLELISQKKIPLLLPLSATIHGA